MTCIYCRLGESACDPNNSKVAEESKLWHQLIKKSLEETKAKKPIKEKEVLELCDAIQNGLIICGRVLERDSSESLDVFTKRVRAVHTTFNMSSGQMYNTKEDPADRKVARSKLQMSKKMMD